MNWDTLIKVSLMGTDRTQIPAALSEELKGLGIEDTDPAVRLIKGAATMNMMLKAGRLTRDFTEELPASAEPEDGRLCSTRATYYLRRILTSKEPRILPEFLDQAKQYQQIITPELMPVLLTASLKSPTLWKKLGPVIGKRGAWLMVQHPDWQTFLAESSYEDWENGKTDQRVTYLMQLRQEEPPKALELLEATWGTEGVQAKKKLLPTLAHQLSSADEGFLNGLLEEKNKVIRTLAIELLQQISASGLNQRITNRLKEFITIQKGKKVKLLVTLPEKVDEAMLYDGIAISTKLYREGIKASWLGQMIRRLPPEKWQKITNSPPVTTLGMMMRSDYAELFILAMIDAAVFHKHSEWTRLLLQFWLDNYDKNRWQNLLPLSLISVLSPVQFNQMTIHQLKAIKGMPNENTPLDLLLQSEHHPWDDELADLFFTRLKNWLATNQASHWGSWNIRKIIKVAGYLCRPALYPLVSKGWPRHVTVWAGWEREIEGCLETLQFRYKMNKALESG